MENEKPVQFSYGGQAIIEGVMMRGQYIAAIAVRNPKGEIVVKEEPLNAALYRSRIARTPFLRGLVMLWDALGIGTRALLWSSDIAMEEEDGTKPEFSFEGAAGMGLVVVSLGMGIGLFFVFPAALSAAVKSLTGMDSRFTADVIEGLMKLSLVIGYIWAIGRMKDVKRIFSYHGAEHKTINAYEAGVDLNPDNVDAFSVQHPRCGTAFLLTLVSLSVLIHIITGRPHNIFLLLASRVGLVLPIAGIAYEILRFSSKHQGNRFMRWINRPNMALQNLTTREPDKAMLEVAIAALQRVLAAEKVAVGIPVEPATGPVSPAEAVPPAI